VDGEQLFKRAGDLILFSQYGVKLDFDNGTTNAEYYGWLDGAVEGIGEAVPGASIIEKPNDRIQPRRNTGVYYDTADYKLLRGDAVLRTTSNPITHAFCAFKLGEDEQHVRRDHRYVFEGEDKRTIQLAPASPEADAIVKGLLSRVDITHPGTFLRERMGISGDALMQSLCLAQDRRTFYVLLDGSDALRCSLDRVEVTDLRRPESARVRSYFSEVELPVYPRISPAVAADARLGQIISVLADTLQARFGVAFVSDSKYRRAARAVGLQIQF
jgi:hypothetical protein